MIRDFGVEGKYNINVPHQAIELVELPKGLNIFRQFVSQNPPFFIHKIACFNVELNISKSGNYIDL